MTDNQLNYYGMAQTSIGLLDKNTTIIGANAKVNAIILIIKDNLKAIDTASLAQGLDLKGATDTKKQAKTTAAALAMHVCSGLKSYADDINDSILASEIHFSESHFIYGADKTIANRMQTVHDKAAPIPIANLTPFNIVANDITNLQSAINDYKNATPLKKILRANAKAFTQQLIPLFSSLRTQFKKLDNIIHTFKLSQSIFVAGYDNARIIIDLGKSAKTKELNLQPHHFEAIFGQEFIEGDTFTIRNHSEVPVLAALSDVPAQMPTDIVVEIPPHQEFKLAISADFGGKFRHWLMIHNANDLDDAHITIILAHGKSQSQAQSPGQTA